MFICEHTDHFCKISLRIKRLNTKVIVLTKSKTEILKMETKQKTMADQRAEFFGGFDLKEIAIMFVVVVVVVGFGAEFLADQEADATNGSTEEAIYQDGLTGLSELTSKLGTIAKVVVLAIVIVVLSVLGIKASGGRR